MIEKFFKKILHYFLPKSSYFNKKKGEFDIFLCYKY